MNNREREPQTVTKEEAKEFAAWLEEKAKAEAASKWRPFTFEYQDKVYCGL